MPVKVELTPKILSYLKKNRLKQSQKEMARALGIGHIKVAQFLRDNNLKLTKQQSLFLTSKKMKGKTNFTAKEDAFITCYLAKRTGAINKLKL